MSEDFEVGLNLALSDGVGESIDRVQQDMLRFDKLLQSGGVSVSQLRKVADQPSSPVRRTANDSGAKQQPMSDQPLPIIEPPKSHQTGFVNKSSVEPEVRASSTQPTNSWMNKRASSPTIGATLNVVRAQDASFRETLPMQGSRQVAGLPRAHAAPSDARPKQEAKTTIVSDGARISRDVRVGLPEVGKHQPQTSGWSSVITSQPIHSLAHSSLWNTANVGTAVAPATSGTDWGRLPSESVAPRPAPTPARPPPEKDVYDAPPNVFDSAHSPTLSPRDSEAVWPTPTSPVPSAPQNIASHQSPTEGDVFLDGLLVGRWMSKFLQRGAERASSGPTGFDGRRNRLLPGATVGG